MATFFAHYRSPNASGARAKGMFEFVSESRLGSKSNAHDARVRMLELYGNEALSWTITDIERKKVSRGDTPQADGQMELDFRAPVDKPVRKRRQSTKRGVL